MANHLLPPNATPQERAVSETLSRTETISVPIRELWRPQECPARLLPWLAWHPPSLTSGQWLLLAAFGIVQMSIPYLMFARGVKSVAATEAALIVLLEPVLTPVWVAVLGWEVAPTATWLGGGLIVGGLVLRYTVWSRPGDPIDSPDP